MTSSPHGPDALGDTHATVTGTEGSEGVTRSQSQKPGRGGDRRLQPACVNAELLVTAGQPYGGEYVPGPCTHRPSRHESWSHLKPVGQPGELGGSRLRWGW